MKRTHATRARRLALSAALAGFALAAVPAAGVAHVSVCHAGDYAGADTTAFPSVGRLRAVNVPRIANGEVGPCMIADFVAGGIQEGWADHSRLPRTVHPADEGWDAGRWRCEYKQQSYQGDTYETARCHSISKRWRVVTMDLGS